VVGAASADAVSPTRSKRAHPPTTLGSIDEQKEGVDMPSLQNSQRNNPAPSDDDHAAVPQLTASASMRIAGKLAWKGIVGSGRMVVAAHRGFKSLFNFVRSRAWLSVGVAATSIERGSVVTWYVCV